MIRFSNEDAMLVLGVLSMWLLASRIIVTWGGIWR